MCLSSALSSGGVFTGCRPDTILDVRSSVCSLVTGPSHPDAPGASTGRRPLVTPQSGMQLTGYHYPRPTRGSGRDRVRLRRLYPAGWRREASGGVKDPMPHPGNAVSRRFESAGRPDVDETPDQPPNGGCLPTAPASSHSFRLETLPRSHVSRQS